MCDAADEFGAAGHFEWRRARRPHRCDACGETVPKGDLYFSYRGVYDGSWHGVKQCARCQALYAFLVAARPREYISMTLDCGEVWDGPETDHHFAFWSRRQGQRHAEESADRIRRQQDIERKRWASWSPEVA